MRGIDLGRAVGLMVLFNILGIILNLITHWPVDPDRNFWLGIALTILWAIRDQQRNAA